MAALVLLGCANGPGRTNLIPGAVALQAPGLPAFPPPSALKLGSYTEAGLQHVGADYTPELPHANISAAESDLQFDPHWENSKSPPDNLAYAGYGFDLSGYGRVGAVRLDWAALPPDGSCWIGLANFTHDRWLWLQPDAAHTVMIDFGKLLDSQATLVAIVLVTGTQQCSLADIRVEAQLVPQISDVQPRNGYTSETLAFSATLTGSEMLTYAWEFGGGATPNTSSERAPIVTFGAPGSYACTLIVSNGAGADMFHFSLAVEDAPLTAPWPMYGCNSQRNRSSRAAGPHAPHLAWSFRTTGPGFIFSEAAIGPDGTIYLGSLYDYNTHEWNPDVTALNPDGSVKWHSPKIFPKTPVAQGLDGTLYVGSQNYLYALNPDGTVLWRYVAEDLICSSICISPTGDVLFSTVDKIVNCVKADGTLRWAYDEEMEEGDCQSRLASTPNGTIYVASDTKHFYAINSDGSLAWSYAVPSEIKGYPVIADDGTVYFGDCSSTLYALNPDGTEQWTYDVSPDLYVNSPHLGTDGSVYFTSITSYYDRRGVLHALNRDGTQQWEAALAETYWYNLAVSNADGAILVVDNTGTLTTYSLTGEILWVYTVEDNGGDMVHANPQVAPDGTIYLSCWNGSLLVLEKDGSFTWQYAGGGGIDAEPAVDQHGTVYFSASDRNTYAVDANGELKWTFHTPMEVQTTPAVAENGSIYLACKNGSIYAVDADGNLAWEYVTDAGHYARVFDPLAIAEDGSLLALSSPCELRAINPDGTLRWIYAIQDEWAVKGLLVHPNGNIIFDVWDSLIAVTPQGGLAWKLAVDVSNYLYASDFTGNIYRSADRDVAGIPCLLVQAHAADGGQLWSAVVSHNYLTRAVAINQFGSVYANTYCNEFYEGQSIVGFDQAGNDLWDLSVADKRFTDLALDVHGTIYTVEIDEVTGACSLLALTPNGTTSWEAELPSCSVPVFSYTSPVVGTNQMLYVASADGSIYAFTD